MYKKTIKKFKDAFANIYKSNKLLENKLRKEANQLSKTAKSRMMKLLP